MPSRNNKCEGIEAEARAARLLARKGYEIVAANYAAIPGSGCGEIDLIVRRGRTIVFVEVKYRATIEIAAAAISPRQMGRIARQAEVFLGRHPEYAGFDCRYDAVLFDPSGRAEHVENAFGY